MRKVISSFILVSFCFFAVAGAGASSAPVATKLVVPEVAADVPGFVDGAPLTPAYVEAVGRLAYLWAWPLINMRSRHTMFSRVPEPVLFGGVLPVAPIGQLSMLSDYLKPEQRFVTSPNQDVVYGAGFFSLDEQPVIIQVPDFGDRFWVYQIVDQRTDSFAEVGIQYKTQPGHYLLVGPGWEGETPKGVKGVFRSSTNVSAIFPRVFMDDSAADRKAIQPLINQIMAYPLSEYDGTMKTKVWKDIPTLENKNAGGSAETQWVVPEKFADQLPAILKDVPPLPGEEALYGWMRSVLNAARENPELRKALVDAAKSTEKEVVSGMFEFRNNGVAAGNGWRTQKNAAQFGYDYFQRTATAKGNMFSNRPVETMYFGNDFDSRGERLNGAKNYTVTFARGQVPPVNGFWSLTLYNQKHFFAPNAMKRFSLGTKNKDLAYNDDGSLTIYVQPTNPGKERQSNWLPSPKDENFSLYIRAYWPKEAILRGEWTPPKIEAVNDTKKDEAVMNKGQDHLTTMDTRIGKLTFDHAMPTPETRQKLYDELDFQRAVQSVLWAEPAINNALFFIAMRKAGVPNLGAMVYDKRQQPGHETLTPNQSVVYLYDMINLKETGPVVHEVPAGPINAGFFDTWMRSIGDFGIVGTNKGRGDKGLLIPPGYEGEIPDGYQVVRPKTYQVFSITRVTVKEGMSEEQATALLKKIRTYRLSDAQNPPPKVFVMMGDPAKGGKEFRMNRPSGLDYWKVLHAVIHLETTEERDRMNLATLAALGIEKGKPFKPDERMAGILIEAEKVGRMMMINEAFSPRYVPDGVRKDLYPGTHWENIQLLPQMSQRGPRFDYMVNRMIAFYQANGAQFAWNPRDFEPGFGQKYAAAYMDASGDWLKGENHYSLKVPANVPVKDFWSVAVYDTQTRALIETPQHVAEINPDMRKLKANEDGSITLHFGPEAPAGMASNWIQTIPGRAWFAYFRWYGPTEAYYDKSWRLPDIERADR